MKQPHKGVGEQGVIFSPDSGHAAHEAMSGGHWRVVVDGRAGREFDGTDDLTFSPDSQHLAYVAGRGQTHLIVVDTTEGPDYEGMVAGSRLVFLREGVLRVLAYKGAEIVRAEVTIRPDKPGSV